MLYRYTAGAVMIAMSLLLLVSCSPGDSAQASQPKGGVGVLLVNHGSHSPRWRQALHDLESSVRNEVLATEGVSGIRTAFMEYTEPSIATQLKAFDKDGVSEVLIVPIFLTVSSHSFDDIPNIIGSKDEQISKVGLLAEGIECYTPKAKVTLAPLLDFSKTMRSNLRRRTRSLSTDPENEGVVLVAYGSKPYDLEWRAFMEEMRSGLKEDLGIEAMEYSWCGHIASYSPEPTADAISKVLKTKERALVVPVLVAVDEDFQFGMIQAASDRAYPGGEVVYRGDSILPEPGIESWIVQVVKGHCGQ
ncbi:MAG: CbiX/SirB N-terminal domain-containing protein [Planctomycetes bacterium]|nr:CbiX/SirB N-terminal domain-containing protein [Planctomycetota bacterium]